MNSEQEPEYIVISENSKEKLEQEVNKKIKDGWKVKGSFSSFQTFSSFTVDYNFGWFTYWKKYKKYSNIYSQAMVKYKN